MANAEPISPRAHWPRALDVGLRAVLVFRSRVTQPAGIYQRREWCPSDRGSISIGVKLD